MFDVNSVIGKKYNNWTILEYLFSKRSIPHYKCQCKCGTMRTIRLSSLKSNDRQCCFLCKKEYKKELYKPSTSVYKNYKHGFRHTKIYEIWKSMHGRCYVKSNTSYKYYGAKGISVCDSWHKFENFLNDMKVPQEGLQLDRINGKGNYEPSNCRWVTREENNKNRSLRNKKSPGRKTLYSQEKKGE